ncbi:MAG: hypothetical protein PUE44_08175 [Bulleidia sp.]|nr:hypothetical protein [Erysipelotrichaceae bacterium]MDD6664355.1 hypothetical protein [Bulleidia sp.]MDY4809313.1 hypothetical protein [Bulleidia sp.]HAW12511.1 hypothetical protein [Erysipelotrichaceae bacterium]
MSKLKKSNVKKKSDRALEHQMALEAEETRKAEELEKKKQRSRDFTNHTMDAVFPIYTMLCAILGFLFAQLGIFSLIGIVLGIIGLRRYKEKKKDKFFYLTLVSFGVCLFCGCYWIIAIGYILIQGL